MFDSFDIDAEDYSDVLAHDDDCKIQAKNIVEQANCQVMKNRAAQAIKDRHSGRRSTFDIIKNWANHAVIDLDSIKPVMNRWRLTTLFVSGRKTRMSIPRTIQ